MKALVTQNGLPHVANMAMPIIESDDEVLLKVKLAGICRTDILAAYGKIPVNDNRILGHEFCAEIVELGQQANRLKTGQRVAVNPVLACQNCIHCEQQQPHLCSNTELLGIHQNGAFAEYIIVPQAQVYPVKASFSDKLVAYAEPVAAMLSILQANIPKQSHIVINGNDRISLLCELILKSHGYQKVSLQADKPCDVLVITSLINNDLPLQSVKPGGLIIVKSRSPFLTQLNLGEMVRNRLTITGMNYSTFEEALIFIEENALELSEFLGPCYSLEEFSEAFSDNQKKLFLQAS
ncbi:zinc-dependent alcohol dehydrogenase [Aliikangiella sp. IMCC44359]|uniref:zinc-dependent alcohol dehydrogenase n=1 Tax=Aliikangiella sp. IMCC44359 TaxID=3459125 RepID=UPI00403B1982